MQPLTIAVASGKGGTGKTTVAVNLVLSLPDAQYIDCDVETPNGHLFLHPEIRTSRPVMRPLPQIDQTLCTLCGDCADACQFNALAVTKKRVMVFSELCHSCGVCGFVCPETGAITEVQGAIGTLELGVIPIGMATAPTGAVGFVQGTLNLGEMATVSVIKAVKGELDPTRVRILDAPAGTGCPMVETVRGADYCLLVTEPTPFGLHDLELAVGVARGLGVPCGVVLNRCDIGDQSVSDYCRAQAVPVLMEIPFDRALAAAYARGIPLVAAEPAWQTRFQALYEAIRYEVIRYEAIREELGQ